MVILLYLACTDKTDDTAPASTELDFTFSENLTFIFDRNCAYTGCHFPPDAEPNEEGQAGMDLSHGAAYASIVGVPSDEVPTMMRIAPGDPEGSYLYLKLNDRQAEVGGTGTRMPTELFLSAPEIQMFADWILAGAPNN